MRLCRRCCENILFAAGLVLYWTILLIRYNWLHPPCSQSVATGRRVLHRIIQRLNPVNIRGCWMIADVGGCRITPIYEVFHKLLCHYLEGSAKAGRLERINCKLRRLSIHE
jgi:hypothetical protein